MKQEHKNTLRKYWLIVCNSDELKNDQIKSITLLDIPIVLFRDQTKIAALVDNCPHRNAPLSKGFLENNKIQCPYHGWTFSSDGLCQEIPGLCINEDLSTKMKVKSFACKEQDGYIWIKLNESTQEILTPKYFHHKNEIPYYKMLYN